MQKGRNLSTWAKCAVVFPIVLGLTAASPAPTAKLKQVPRANLCVTEGAIEELPGQRLSVTVPQNARLPKRTNTPHRRSRLHLPGLHRKRSSPGLRGTPPPVWSQASRARRLQSRLRHVAHRTRIEARRLCEEQSGRAHQRGMRQPWVSQHQGNPQQTSSHSASGPGAFPPRRNEPRRNEGFRGQCPGLGRASRPRSPDLRRPRWHTFRQRALADRSTRPRTHEIATGSSARLSHTPRRIRVVVLAAFRSERLHIGTLT